MEKILVRIDGGLGKNIAGTAIVEQIRHKYPDAVIHVQASYPEVFSNISYIDRFFPLALLPYFYEEHKEFEVLDTNPYSDKNFRMGKEHLIETWCRKLNLDIPNMKRGRIELDDSEIKMAESLFMNIPKDKKLVAFQWVGGTSYMSPQEANNPLRQNMQTRNIPQNVAQGIVDFLNKAGYGVVQISLPTEPKLQNALYLPEQQGNTPINPRFIFGILKRCDYGIFIDSFAQHAWAALGKEKALVLWGGTNPVNFGYVSNVNIDMKGSCSKLHCNRPDTYLFDVIGNSQPWKCSFNGKCMQFDLSYIEKNFKEIVGNP